MGGWEGRGPDHCRRLLVEQGIAFDDEGRPDEGQRVAWDEFRRRDQSEPVE
jgi:hypothetical protein